MTYTLVVYIVCIVAKRINIVLSEERLKDIDRVVKKGERSRFIDQAVRHYLATHSTEALATRLAQAAERDRDIDREVAADWFFAV